MSQPGRLPREIGLQNASNLRDLGGWQAGARRVRLGLVFRAPALLDLSPQDQATVAALGLRTVCDLRGVAERERAPVELAGADHRSLPIEPSVGASLKDILRTGRVSGAATSQDMLALLQEAYEAYALQCAGQYRLLFAAILEEGRLPLLLHCSAGKDRTGFGSALLLSALGVSWDDVMADYLATNALWRRETVRHFDMMQPLRDTLFGAHGELLEAAFAALRAQAGSLDAYLEDAMGLDSQARERLEALLLED